MTDLPKQIQQQLEEAEAIDAQLAANAEPPAADPPAEPPAAEPTSELEPAQPPIAAEPPKPPSGDGWEQKYRTLQGMFDAEKRRLDAQVQTLTSTVQSLTDQLTKLTAQPAQPAEPPKVFTDKDVEAFGPELVQLLERTTQAVTAQVDAKWAGQVQKLEQTISALESRTNSTAESQTLANRERYFRDLRTQLPDLDGINGTEAFTAWCLQPHPLTGEPRQKLLDDAFDKFDVARTIAYFNEYKATLPPASRTPAPAPQPNPELARQVPPNSGSKPATPQSDPNVNKVWTGAEVDQFYADVRKGAYRGREAERAAIESQIDQAAAENRIR